MNIFILTQSSGEFIKTTSLRSYSEKKENIEMYRKTKLNLECPKTVLIMNGMRNGML